jgi:2-oxoglutarate/2-oxoacid ferredoxin oxidoreductase subunit alpha
MPDRAAGARADAVGDRIFIEGNRRGARRVYGGATVCAWYPITPSSSLAEAFSRIARSYRVDRRPEARTATPSSRPRTSSPPSAW